MAAATRYLDKPWLSHYEEGVPQNINFENLCLHEFLDRSGREFPEKKALNFQGYTLSYKELTDMVNRFAACLIDFGVAKGDRVAVLLPNLIPTVVCHYAILKIGGVVVMNNPLYSDSELEYQFNNSEAKILITLDLLGSRMIDLRPKTSIKQIIYTSIGDYLPFPKSILFPLVAKGKGLAAKVKPAEDVFRWKDVIKQHSSNPPQIDISFDDTAMCQYTGGTTGVSKGALLKHGSMSRQVQQIMSWFPRFNKGEEIMLGALPIFHIMGLQASMSFAMSMGWELILVPKPQPEPLLENIRKFRPTFAPMVPTMFIGMLADPAVDKTDMTCLKVLVSGGSPIPVEIIKQFKERTGASIVEAFGMTEASPCTHMNPFTEGKSKPGSIGLPLPDTISRIVSLEDGKSDVPQGEAGEMVITGPQVMAGYLNMPEETANTLQKGWLFSGDIATMDEEGYFFIVDRKKDMIIAGGYNIYPREIDEVLFEHPAIQEACAVGIPHP
ncbi:MAG: long-chain fatty acid--CoA ligase, partial [bacterium]|nr:long-chain fatty acid--CoA ligase [bacterium]